MASNRWNAGRHALSAALLLGLYLPAAGQEEAAGSAARALLEEAAAAETSGDWEQAEVLLRQALERTPDDPQVILRLGNLLYWGGGAGEGMGLLYRAWELSPADDAVALALVDALLDERDYYFHMGDAYSADSALQRAEDVLESRRPLRPDDPDIRRRHARILWRRHGRESESVEVAQGLLLQFPNDATLHQDFMDAVTAAASYDQALRFYDELPADYWLAAWFRGQIHVNRAHYHYNRYLDDDQAIADYQRAAELVLESARLNDEYFDSASESAAYYRAWTGWTYLRRARFVEAEREFFAALGRNPLNDSAQEGLSHLGEKLNKAGDQEAARDFYRRACQWVPQRSDFWNHYGLLCRDTGLHEESYAAYRRALSLSPDDPRIINDCALLLQYHLDRDLDLAERWFLRAREIARTQWIDALDDTAAAAALSTYGDALVNLGRLYDGQGRMLEASSMWNELREVDPERPELPGVGG